MTLNEMASAIRNNIGNGLKEVSNFSYSIEQIIKEIGTTRNQIISEQETNSYINWDMYAQKIDDIPVHIAPFPITGEISDSNLTPYIAIPKLATTLNNTAVIYVGPADYSLPMKVYYDLNHLRVHQYSRVIKHRPHVFVDITNNILGTNTIYFFNVDPVTFKYASVRIVAADPISIIESDGGIAEEEEFPAPSSIQQLIIDTITTKYIKYYKELNHPYQPNTQTDHN